jgi:asparagine synthase (glutamine-hydrolysing)
MCGFVGCAGSNINIKTDKLNDALDSIIHRGPDDRGVETGDWWCLGFQRLSILDLSQNGHQPMISKSGNTIITFNGELYNYRDIEKILSNFNIKMKGGSDTEVLLEFYEYLNGDIESLLNKCNGMFSFTIVDKIKGKILLARDRLGVKPLYYSNVDNDLVFGSEIKAIRHLISEHLTLSDSAFFSYLRLGFIPSWECIYNEIESLDPGCWAEWGHEERDVKLYKYWMPDTSERVADNHAIDFFGELLEDATKIRLNSDVPIGIFLSGGIDSGLVASQVKKCAKNNISAHTVRFPGWGNDESLLSQKTADHLGIELKIYDADIPSISKLVNIISHFDQPFSDPSAIATSLVCEEASKNVSVILSGDGGDESFAGYREYPRALKYGWIDSIPDILSNSMGKLISLSRNGKIHNIGERLKLSSCVRSAWTHIYPSDDSLERLLNSKWTEYDKFNPEIMCNNLSNYDNLSPLRKAQLGDILLYLPDNVLRKVDRMSMKHSLEVRSPFLDYRMVEFGLSLPSKLKIKGSTGKKILRSLSEERLPIEIQNAEKKGFGIPLEDYFITNNKINPFVKDSIIRLGDTDWFDRIKLINYMESPNIAKKIRNIYRLFCFSIWLEAQSEVQ